MERARSEASGTVSYESGPDPRVRLLTIDRPEKMNAVGAAEAAGLQRALTDFRDDDSARVLVITGAGSEAFCAGADLGAVAAMYSPDTDAEPLFEVDSENPASPAEGNIGPTRWTDLYKPVIAAVNLQALECRPRRRRHPEAATPGRARAGPGPDHHRSGHRGGRSRADRTGQRGDPERPLR